MLCPKLLLIVLCSILALHSAGFMVVANVKEIDQQLMHIEESPWPFAQSYLQKCTVYSQLNMNLFCSKYYSIPESTKLTHNVHFLYLELSDSFSKLIGSCDPKEFIDRCADLMASDIHGIRLFSDEFLDDLRKCSTTTEIVRSLLVYSSWCDHSLVEELVEIYKCSESYEDKIYELLGTFMRQIAIVKETNKEDSFPFPCDLMVPCESSAYTVMTTRCVSMLNVNVIKSLVTVQFELTNLSCLLLAKTNNPFIFFWLIPKTVVSLIFTKVYQISQHLWKGGISELAVYPDFVYATSGCISYGSLGLIAPDVS